MALPSEIGLYFDFEVTEDGVPYGCPGFETFSPEYWKTSYAAKWSRVPKVDNPNPNTNWHWKKADPECPFNTMAIPDGSTPLHQIALVGVHARRRPGRAHRARRPTLDMPAGLTNSLLFTFK